METDMNDKNESNEKCVKNLWNLLAERSVQIDSQFIIKLTKESKNVNKEVKNSCKVLHFSSEWNFEEVLGAIKALNHIEYPQLFIFIIEGSNFDSLEPEAACEPPRKKLKLSIENLKICLLKFGPSRPLVVQLTSKDQEKSEIYYKTENFTKFKVIGQNQSEINKVTNFSTFLWIFLNGHFDNFKILNEYLQDVEDSTLIIRFARALNLQNDTISRIILEMSKNCSLQQFLALLDAPFDGTDNMLSHKNQSFLSRTYGHQFEGESSSYSSAIVDAQKVASKNIHRNFKEPQGQSVLSVAVKYKNKDLIDYLIFYWSQIIQKLPVYHQIRVSTIAYECGQLEVLYDLLNVADFPFPRSFKIDVDFNRKLSNLTSERMDFHSAIDEENFEKLDKFITQHPSLKFAYSSDNKTAIHHAVSSNKYMSYFYLVSAGFTITDEIDNKEVENMKKQITKLSKENVKLALKDENRAVKVLSARSLIHNRRISKEKEAVYRLKIKEWLEAINKLQNGPELLNVAASCENLKVIFNFESETIYQINLQHDHNGLTRTFEIFIGADYSGTNREQFIKGVLAHELCHFALNLVYQNTFLPYYKDDEDTRKELNEIVKKYDLWSAENAENIDDECNELISGVYNFYSSSQFPYELIVRVIQILAQFDNDEDKTKYLQEKFELLFNFWETKVVPDLKNFDLNLRKDVERFNKYVGFLSDLSMETIEFVDFEKVSKIFNFQYSIVASNIPKLLFIEIYKFTIKKYGKLATLRNLFINPEQLCKDDYWKEFREVYKKVSKLNIFVDCSEEVKDCIWKIIVNNDLNFVFVVSTKAEMKSLEGILKDKINKRIEILEIDYNWNDVNHKSHEQLLETKVKFQNCANLQLKDLISFESSPTSDSPAAIDPSDVIDPQLLQMLTEKSQIHINPTAGIDNPDQNFELLFQTRNFIKIENNKTNHTWTKSTAINKVMSLKELLSATRNKRYILISDMAGNGKSWVMKDIAKVLQIENRKHWVTYVDLKQFIDEFKELKMEPDFSTFMAEKILKSQKQFERKIFQKLFKVGKVFVLFDGFDEIAPKCAEVVRELARSMEFHDGNQLWIATREYFEVSLQKRLHIDLACKLDEFTEKEGVNFIVRSWMAVDMRQENIKSKEEFENFIKSSPNHSNYKNKAQKIVKDALMKENLSVGLPQLFKMIADTNEKDAVVHLKGSQMYSKFLDKLYERWSGEKGLLRKKANTKSQQNDCNFRKFHQFAAVLSVFPDYVEIIFIDYDGSEWPDEEVIACGIMSKKDGKFIFLHETFREFLTAEAVANKLVRGNLGVKIIELFVEILTVEKYGVIRMFLNDMIKPLNLDKIAPKVQQFIAQFYDMNSFHDIFTKGLENLADFIVKILKIGNYENVKNILNENSWKIATKIKDPKLLWMFFKFIFEFLKIEDLTALIEDNRIFLALIGSALDIEHFEQFLEKIQEKVGLDFIQKGLKLTTSNELGGNLFYFLCQSTNLCAEKVRKIFKILQIYTNFEEILKLMSKCTKNEENILQIYIQNGIKSSFRAVWDETKNCCGFTQYFLELIKHKDLEKKTILHHVACSTEIDTSISFWELLIDSIIDKEEVKQFILETDKNGSNFIHQLVKNHQIFPFIQSTLAFFKDFFNNSQYYEVLTSKDHNGQNILQSVAFSTQNIQVYRLLWDTFEDLNQDSQNFMDFLKEVDSKGEDILTIIIKYSSSEILVHTIEKLQKTSTIKILLSFIGPSTQNYLQLAAIHNESLEFHRSLWEIYKRHYTQSELTQFICHKDQIGDNLLFVAIMSNSVEVVEYIWNQIKDVMNPDDFKAYMLLKRKNGDNLTDISIDNWTHQKKIFSWVQSYIRKMGVDIKFERKERMARYAHIYHKNAVIITTSESSDDDDVKRLKLIRFQKDNFSLDEISDAILKQNEIKNPSKLKIIEEISDKADVRLSTLIIQIDSLSHKLLIDKGFLNIKWYKFKIFDALSIIRCYKCSRFGHKLAQCKSEEPVCPKCAGPHKSQDCNVTFSNCINCIDAKSKFNLNISVSHTAFNPECPTMLSNLKRFSSSN